MSDSKGRLIRAGLCITIFFCLAADALRAAQVEMLSRADPPSDTASGPGGGVPEEVALSADGRYIAFTSWAVNLVPGQNDTNQMADVFLHDRVAGTTILVSRRIGPTNGTANGNSDQPSISADGRWIAFVSTAFNLATGHDTIHSEDVFLFDRDTLTVSRVSPWNGVGPASSVLGSRSPVISADGSWIAFVSERTDLVPGQDDGNSAPDLFLHDRAGGTTLLVSRAAGTTVTTADSTAEVPSLSADGRYVAFSSLATNLVAGQIDNNGLRDDFLFDRVTGTATLLSRSDASPLTAVAGSYAPRISADGAYVTFASVGTGLVPGQTDANGTWDVFLYERASGAMTLVSHNSASLTTTGNGWVDLSQSPQISDDGRYVSFLSGATDAVSGQTDTNGSPDVFLFDRVGGGLTLASHAAAAATTAGNEPVYWFAMSGDGAWITYYGRATDLVSGQSDANDTHDVFLFDRGAGTNRLLSSAAGSATQAADGASLFPTLSADGGVVTFFTAAGDLVAGVDDLNGLYDLALYDRSAGTNAFLTVHAPGMASGSPSGYSFMPSVSADGRYVAFATNALNLIPGVTDDNHTTDVYLVDRVLGTTTLVSHCAAPATTGNHSSVLPVVSADGNYVAFLSSATDLVPGQVDTPGTLDVFLYDRVAGVTTLVSHAAGSPTTAGNGQCGFGSLPALSADGRWVAFACIANNLVASAVDPELTLDIFLFDRVTGETVLVSHAAGSPTAAGDAPSRSPVISADGSRIAFSSIATDLVSGSDLNGGWDVFLYQRSTGAVSLVSRSAASPTTTGNGWSEEPDLSADGRFVAFPSLATNLLPGQVESGGLTEDLFVFDTLTGTMALASRGAAGAGVASGADLEAFDLSADGRYVAFSSKGSDLVVGLHDNHPEVPGGTFDVYVYDGFTQTVEIVSTAASFANSTADGHSTQPRISAGGRFVAFASMADDLGTVGGPLRLTDIFLHDRGRRTTELVSRSHSLPTYPGDGPSDAIALSGDGTVVVFDSQAQNLFPTDLNGTQDVFAYVWEHPEGESFYTVTPCRLLDTRETPPPPSNMPINLLVHGQCGIPSSARAIAANITVLQPAGPGHLTAYTGSFPPLASTLNFAAGKTRANNALLRLSPQGYTTLQTFVSGGGTAHLIVDVSGYFE
jgi:Tol biopolymer transport system component